MDGGRTSECAFSSAPAGTGVGRSVKGRSWTWSQGRRRPSRNGPNVAARLRCETCGSRRNNGRPTTAWAFQNASLRRAVGVPRRPPFLNVKALRNTHVPERLGVAATPAVPQRPRRPKTHRPRTVGPFGNAHRSGTFCRLDTRRFGTTSRGFVMLAVPQRVGRFVTGGRVPCRSLQPPNLNESGKWKPTFG